MIALRIGVGNPFHAAITRCGSSWFWTVHSSKDRCCKEVTKSGPKEPKGAERAERAERTRIGAERARIASALADTRAERTRIASALADTHGSKGGRKTKRTGIASALADTHGRKCVPGTLCMSFQPRYACPFDPFNLSFQPVLSAYSA